MQASKKLSDETCPRSFMEKPPLRSDLHGYSTAALHGLRCMLSVLALIAHLQAHLLEQGVPEYGDLAEIALRDIHEGKIVNAQRSAKAVLELAWEVRMSLFVCGCNSEAIFLELSITVQLYTCFECSSRDTSHVPSRSFTLGTGKMCRWSGGTSMPWVHSCQLCVRWVSTPTY